jgi:hypothetical protein
LDGTAHLNWVREIKEIKEIRAYRGLRGLKEIVEHRGLLAVLGRCAE